MAYCIAHTRKTVNHKIMDGLWLIPLARFGVEIFYLAGNLIVVFGVFHRRFHFGDIRPFAHRVFAIQLQKRFGPGVDVGDDGVDRAFRDADAAINAFVRIDDEHIFAFIKAIDRAHLDAIGILAFDADICDDVGQGRVLFSYNMSRRRYHVMPRTKRGRLSRAPPIKGMCFILVKTSNLPAVPLMASAISLPAMLLRMTPWPQ